jgi:hypothetical protein
MWYQGNITETVDGLETGGLNSLPFTASEKYIRFQFVATQVISEVTFTHKNTDSFGSYKWQGSQNGTDWSDIGAAFTLGAATTQVDTTLSANTTAYLYYQLLGISGGPGWDAAIREVKFKIYNPDTNYTSNYYNEGGSGDRSTVITATCTSGIWEYGSGSNIAWFVDGSYAGIEGSYPYYVSGKFFRFQFSVAKTITEVVIYTASNWATWKWQGSDDGTNWSDIGSEFTIAPTSGVYKDTSLSGNTTAYLYYQLLGTSGNVGWDQQIAEFRFSIVTVVTDPDVSDLLNSWSDSVVIGIGISVKDDLSNWDDLREPILSTILDFEDNLFHYYDEVVTQLWVYHHPLTVDVSDIFDFDDSLDAIALIFMAEEIAFDLGDSNRLSDSIAIFNNLFVELEDDLDNWTDEVALMPGDFVDYAYDTMMYDFLDSIEVDLRQHRGNFDSLTFSDAITISLDAFLQSKSVADSLSNWLDSVSVRLQVNRTIEDDFALYDFIRLFMTTTRSISDTLALSDAISVSLSSQDANLSDSLQLWNDLVSAELQIKYNLNISDTMSLSDAVVNSGVEEDLTYYRRYLNDVVR